MADHTVNQIFNSNDRHEYLIGKDNLYDYDFKKMKLGSIVLNMKERNYTNTCAEQIIYDQNDDKKQVFTNGQKISFNLNPIPYACIEKLEYLFKVQNNSSAAFNYVNIFSMIKSFKIYVNNSQVEEIPAEVIQLYNLLKVRTTNLELMSKQFNASGSGSLAAGSSAEFALEIPSFLYNRGYSFMNLGNIRVEIQFQTLPGTGVDSVILTRSDILLHYQKVVPSVYGDLLGMRSIAGPYLQVDYSSYDYNGVKANTPFNIKLTQNGVCPFIMFYVQTKDNASTITTQFQENQIALNYFKFIGPNNQGLMNNIKFDSLVNNCIQSKHFKNTALIANNLKSSFDNNMVIQNLQVFNVGLNQQLAQEGDIVGGYYFKDNDYELEISSTVDIPYARISVFYFKYQVVTIRDKIVTFLDR